jgi:hypothetical protein
MIGIHTKLTDSKFDGVNAKLVISDIAMTVLFALEDSKWAGMSFRIGDKVANLNFYDIATQVSSHPQVSLEEAVVIVRAAMAKKTA